MNRAVDAFLAQFSLKYRPRSVEVKAYALTQFLAFLEIKNVTDWQMCDQKLIRQYIIERSQRAPKNALKALSPSSMQTQLAAIRVFFDYLVEEEKITHNPAKLIKPPKNKKTLPAIASIELLERILNQPPENDLEVRDLAMCELFYSSGLRLSELSDLNNNDVDLDAQEVRVIDGKGGKDRIVPLGTKAKNSIILWKNVRTKMTIVDENALFISERGNRLTTRQISNRVKAYGAKIGLGINLHPHMLRHSMATHILESSQDIRAVQELLGHADISTTQIYTHLDFGHLSKVFDAAHPRARRKKIKPDSDQKERK